MARNAHPRLLVGVVAMLGLAACNETIEPTEQPEVITTTAVDQLAGDWVGLVYLDSNLVDTYFLQAQPPSRCNWLLTSDEGNVTYSATYRAEEDASCGNEECGTGVPNEACGPFAERTIAQLGSPIDVPFVVPPCQLAFGGDRCTGDPLELLHDPDGQLIRITANGLHRCPSDDGVSDECATVILERTDNLPTP